MRTIIAGSRTLTDPQLVIDAVKESGFIITEVASGRAPGIDTMGEWWCIEHLGKHALVEFPADWDDITAPGALVKTNKWGKQYNALAGHWRNQAMADWAQQLISIHDGSPGSRDMLKRAKEAGLAVYEKRVFGK